MIINLTSRCNGNCIHCMSRCTEDGIDMSFETLCNSIKFIKKISGKVVNISGGEPTIHPKFIDFLNYIKSELPHYMITLCTNGTFTKNMKIVNAIGESGILVQTTYQKDLYKTNLTASELFILSKIGYLELNEPTGERLLAYGRALDNNLKTSSTRISPFCFNMRSLIKNSNMGFVKAINYMELMGKFCSFAIRPDGSVSLGESLCCPAIGNIDDMINESSEQIAARIKNFKCTDCIYAKKLLDDPSYRKILL